MKLSNKVLVAGLCAGMSVALLSGPASAAKKLDPSATVATVGDTKLSLGVANLLFRFSQIQTGGYIRMLLGDDGSNIWEQDLVGNGVPYGKSIKESALTEYERMVLLEQHMDEYGVEITDADKEAISAAASQFLADNSAEVLEKMTATQETVERMLTLFTIEDRMQNTIEESADVEVTEEEVAQKKIRYAYFAIPEPETAEEETEAVTETASEEASEETTEAALNEAGYEETEERTATREAVQAIIDEIKAGTDMEEAVKAFDEEKNVTENHYGANSSTVSAVIIEAADTLTEEGEVAAAPVETENGFYIVQMVDLLDEDATAEEKETLLAQRQREFYSDLVASWEPEELAIDEKVWDAVNYADDFRTPVVVEEETEAVSEETTEAVSEVTSEETTEAVSEVISEETTEAADAESETESES